MEMLRVDADLLAVKTENLYDFRYLMQLNQQKKTCWREAESSDWTTKSGGKPEQKVLKKSFSFICLFTGLLLKLEKKKSIVAFLNKLAWHYFFSLLS